MREAGSIVLVSSYELGHPPLGTAWPAAFLERAGFMPVQVDLAVQPADDELFASARLIVFAAQMHTALALAIRAAERAKRVNPSAKIAFAGWYAVLNERFLFEHGADFVLGGELEDALVELAEAIERGTADRLPRVIAKKEKLDFAPPSRAQLRPLDEYSKLAIAGEERLSASVETSRGCLHLCRHCPIPPLYEGRFFVVPEEVVLRDVGALVEQGAKHVTFSDPDFLNAPTHARRVAAAVHHRWPELTFDFTAKIEHILRHAPLLPELAAHGCIFVVSAVESLSPRVLEILDKGHTREDVARALALLDNAGIELRPSLLPFTPWSTLTDYLELLDFIFDHELVENVDPVQLAVRLLVPPRSLLEDHAEMKPHLVRFEPSELGWIWRHPDPQMDALHAEATAIVEEDLREERAPAETLVRLYAAAARAAGIDEVRRDRARHRTRVRDVPRLTEPWFC